jgi:hypothetical protein
VVRGVGHPEKSPPGNVTTQANGTGAIPFVDYVDRLWLRIAASTVGLFVGTVVKEDVWCLSQTS